MKRRKEFCRAHSSRSWQQQQQKLQDADEYNNKKRNKVGN